MFLQARGWSSEKIDHLALCFSLSCEATAAIFSPEGWRWQAADRQCLKTAVSLFDMFVHGKIYISINGNLNRVQLHPFWSFSFPGRVWVWGQGDIGENSWLGHSGDMSLRVQMWLMWLKNCCCIAEGLYSYTQLRSRERFKVSVLPILKNIGKSG